jgi:hypothetical protein
MNLNWQRLSAHRLRLQKLPAHINGSNSRSAHAFELVDGKRCCECFDAVKVPGFALVDWVCCNEVWRCVYQDWHPEAGWVRRLDSLQRRSFGLAILLNGAASRRPQERLTTMRPKGWRISWSEGEMGEAPFSLEAVSGV